MRAGYTQLRGSSLEIRRPAPWRSYPVKDDSPIIGNSHYIHLNNGKNRCKRFNLVIKQCCNINKFGCESTKL